METKKTLSKAVVAEAVAQLGTAHTVSAGKIRDFLDYGSRTTINDYLKELRKEVDAAAMPAPLGQAPSIPADALEAVWSTLWNAAKSQLLEQFIRLNKELERAQLTIEAQAQDIHEANLEVDEQLQYRVEQAEDMHKVMRSESEMKEAMTILELGSGVKLFETEQSLSKANAEIIRLEGMVKHTQELGARDLELKQQTLQSTIDRLTEQVSEMKAERASEKARGDEVAQLREFLIKATGNTTAKR